MHKICSLVCEGSCERSENSAATKPYDKEHANLQIGGVKKTRHRHDIIGVNHVFQFEKKMQRGGLMEQNRFGRHMYVCMHVYVYMQARWVVEQACCAEGLNVCMHVCMCVQVY